MTYPSWAKLNEEIAYNGHRKVLKKTFQLPDGQIADYDVYKGVPFIVVFAITPDNQVILVRQFRPGPEEFMWELPAGAIKGQETPLQAAKRELLEETGYIGDFEIVNPRCFGSVYATHHAVFLVATHCTKIAEQNLDTDEFVDVVLFDMPQFRELLRASDNMNLLLSYQALEHLRLL